jgi:hypothetical protein
MLTPLILALAEDVVGFRFGQRGDVDVRDAGVFALGLADGPAHDLDGGEALVAGEVEDVVEREFGEDGGDEAEFHKAVRFEE